MLCFEAGLLVVGRYPGRLLLTDAVLQDRLAVRRRCTLRVGAQYISNESLAQRPHGARNALAVGKDCGERFQDGLAVRVGNDEGRQQLDGVTGMAGDLAQNFVVTSGTFAGRIECMHSRTKG